MKRTQKPLVIGNWKMNPQTKDKAQTLLTEIKKALGTKKDQNVEVVIAPPFVYLSQLEKLTQKLSIKNGAQDVSPELQGAFTGETSLPMLKSFKVSHIIVGHSERRANGESDEVVRKKAETVLQGGLIAVVCIGEKTRDAQGDYFNVVESQLQSLIKGIKKAHLSRLVLAYEPIWAIGTQKHATAEDVQEMKLFIQKVLADHFGRNMVSKVRILYGGSVNKDNAKELLTSGKADGFLVGGASLKASEFGAIVSISATHA